MSGRFNIIIKLVGLSLLISTVTLNAQLFRDTATLNLVKEDIDHIYDLKFNSAREIYSKILQSYPEHPIVYLLRGIMTYWENYPLLNTSVIHASFEEDMHECIRLSEMKHNHDDAAEYLLADLSARGMLMNFYSGNDLILEVTPLTLSTYKYLRRAFDFASDLSDLHYFTGMYDYYREAYPKIHPVYKSLAFLFPHGDTETGLKELQAAAVSAVVLGAESYASLSWIYLYYENKLPESIIYCKALLDKYPGNVQYRATYIRNLLLIKNYDEAEKLISSSINEDGNKYFQAQLIILKGILEEKKYRDNKLAQQYYNKGISDISVFGKYGNEYSAYAYFGLSRISDATGEKQTRKIYRKEALDLADFKKVNFDK